MKRNLVTNQHTMPSMMMPVPKMAQAPHNHDIFHHSGEAYFDAPRTIPAKKSKSINIKRSSDKHDPLSISPFTEQMYELATWRMYYRITSARQVRSVVTPPVTPQRNARSSDLLPSSFQLAATEDYTVHNGMAFKDGEFEDEGVFIMDL
jgi:hypothetical protein